MTDLATQSSSPTDPAADPGQVDQPGHSASMREIDITQLEAAINYWRAQLPSYGDEMKLCQQANALSKPYALMIVQRRKTLPLNELEPNALMAYQSYDLLMNGPT
jgi:hypothetical protein